MSNDIGMPPSEIPESNDDVNARFEEWLHSDEPEVEETPEEAPETGDEVEDEQTEADDSEDSEQEQTEDEEAEDSTDDDTETLSLDGEDFQVPKAVAEKVEAIKKRMEGDYTRKTQEAAELRKSAEAYQQRVEQDAAFYQQNVDLLGQWQSVEAQLKEYEQVDWAALAEQDIGAYSKHKEMRDSLRARQQQIGQEFQQRQQFLEQHKAEEYKRQWQETVNTVKKAIPHYDSETDKKAVQAAVKLGEKYGLQVDVKQLQKQLDPLVWIGLVELSKYLDVVEKRPATQKKVAEAPKAKPSVKPAKSSKDSRESRIRKLLAQGRIREAALL